MSQLLEIATQQNAHAYCDRKFGNIYIKDKAQSHILWQKRGKGTKK